MRNDPHWREPRWPAVGVWTVTGLLGGLAIGIFSGAVLMAVVLGGVLGLLWGLFTTRSKDLPDED